MSHRMTDPCYHEERSTLQTVQDKARKEKELAKKRFKPRMIVHPHFQNITSDAAIKVCCNPLLYSFVIHLWVCLCVLIFIVNS